VKNFTTLLIFSVLYPALAGGSMAQTDTNSSPSPPDATQKAGTATKDTVVPAKETIQQQKATANPMKVSNPENIKVKPTQTVEQNESNKARKKYEKYQHKEQKKEEKAQKKANNEAKKSHATGK
jgi:hypothetical protein